MKNPSATPTSAGAWVTFGKKPRFTEPVSAAPDPEPGEPVEVDATVVDGSVCISVRDHGIGIPARDLERIFERFYRVDRARSRATGGTGLGLSIVRHVAQAHGGDVTVESLEGEGSTFRLRVPLPSSKKLSEAS